MWGLCYFCGGRARGELVWTRADFRRVEAGVFIAEPVLAVVQGFFGNIFLKPHRAEIFEIKTFVGLLWVKKVERGARTDVVDVPFPNSSTVISPRHFWLPLAFQMGPQFLN